MGEVTICSSSKYYGVVQSLAGELVDRQVVVNTPRFDFDEEIVEVRAEQKWALTHEFLGKVRRSACIYVVAEGGYTGRSVCIEIGFAAALDIPVFISERPLEEAVNALVSEVVSIDDAPDFLTGLLNTVERS
ncbi:hypothetical protein GCM10010435_80870 [Winogradskya consettensis]|uniref:Nucleoside 2-deoxyribosyltransferase n=1 Tax=Winogradskya consettensis TaxID=113560 RepID=A0A919SQK5_9ACTN|nr:hypothetical protein [Actinoplanes consettensis]GIM77190.1 hypothetical protein Aco04nite_54110 [Actinoplanes consettensis]